MDDATLAMYSTLSTVLSVLMFLATAGVLGAVLYRFRTTPAGLALGAAFGGFLFMRIVSWAIGHGPEEPIWLVPGIFTMIEFLLTLVVAVGIVLIPRSLRALASKVPAAVPATSPFASGGGAPPGSPFAQPAGGAIAGSAFAQAPMTGAAAPAPSDASIPATKSDDFARTLAAPDYTFDKIAQSMSSLDARPQGSPGKQVAPGEPGSAAWTSGSIQIRYTFDAQTKLRKIELRGPQARFLLNDLLNMVYMPTLEGYKVSSLLSSADPRDLLTGIRAAEFIGVCGDQSFYTQPVGALTSHADATIAAEAKRVLAVLNSR
jgi:hypothetical protein